MSLITFLDKLLHHWFHFGENRACNLRLLLHENAKGILIAVRVTIVENFVKDERVVSVQRENKLPTILVTLALSVDVLNNL